MSLMFKGLRFEMFLKCVQRWGDIADLYQERVLEGEGCQTECPFTISFQVGKGGWLVNPYQMTVTFWVGYRKKVKQVLGGPGHGQI